MNWLLLLISITTTQPSATTPPPVTPPPVTSPINLMVAKPMSSEYSVLLSHSMFVRGHVAIDTHRTGGFVSSVPPPSSPTTEPSLAKPEDTLVFNGVTVANGEPMAFIEDTGSGNVQTVVVGQSIAQGKITEITLDTLSYRNNTRTMQLHIGQNLSGNDATPAMTTPTSTTEPSGLTGDSGGDSVIDRMRRKRAQELLGH